MKQIRMSWIGGRHDKIGIGTPIFGTFAKEGKERGKRGRTTKTKTTREEGNGRGREGEEGCGIGRRRASERGESIRGTNKARSTSLGDSDDRRRRSAPLATTTKRTRKFGETCSTDGRTDRASDRSLILVEQAHSYAAVSCSSE